MMSPSGLTSSANCDMTVRRLINDTSAVTMSAGPPKSLGEAKRMLMPSWTVTLGAAIRLSCSRLRPTSTAATWLAPCCRRQSVKPPVDAPTSMQSLPATSISKRFRAARSLSPPRLTNRRGRMTSTTSPLRTMRAGFSAIAPFTVTDLLSISLWASLRLAAMPSLKSSTSMRVIGFSLPHRVPQLPPRRRQK